MSDFMAVYEDYENEALPNEGRFDGEVSDIDVIITRAGAEMVKIEYTYEEDGEDKTVEQWLRWDPDAEFRVKRRFFRALDALGVTAKVLKAEQPACLEDVVNILGRETMGKNVAVVIHINDGYVNVNGYMQRDE